MPQNPGKISCYRKSRAAMPGRTWRLVVEGLGHPRWCPIVPAEIRGIQPDGGRWNARSARMPRPPIAAVPGLGALGDLTRQPVEDPGVDRVQAVPVQESAQALRKESRGLLQLGRPVSGFPHPELKPRAARQLHFRPQTNQPVRLQGFHPPEIQRVADTHASGCRRPLRSPAPPNRRSIIPRIRQIKSA